MLGIVEKSWPEESTTMLKIVTIMLATNKIENKPKNSVESLKIVESCAQSLKKPRKLSKEEKQKARKVYQIR